MEDACGDDGDDELNCVKLRVMKASVTSQELLLNWRCHVNFRPCLGCSYLV